MPMEPLPDGFLKLANELSRRAASEPDPTMKAQLLQTAERYRRMDEQARTVLTEAATLQAKVRAPARHPVAQSVLYIVFTGFFWVLAFLHEFDTASVALARSEEHTSELQSRGHLVCRLLLEKKKKNNQYNVSQQKKKKKKKK